MKWHISNKEKQRIQQGDEMLFKNFFNQHNYNPAILDHDSAGKAPDFSLTKNGIQVIIEVKSKFGNEEYEKIATEITNRINELPFGYEYSFQHYYEKMPSQNNLQELILQIKDRMDTLLDQLEFPHHLSEGKWPIQKQLKNSSLAENEQFEEIPEIEKTAITLYNCNNSGKMNCIALSGSYQGIPGERDKNYFRDSFKRAKEQLKLYIKENRIVGIIFFNHSTSSWHLTDIMALYGDLEFPLDHNTNNFVISLCGNKLLWRNKKTWLSFFGFFDRSGNSSVLTIYRNGFARIELPIDYFAIPECTLRTIRLSDDQREFIVE